MEIYYNTEFKRWEVYGRNSVYRNGEFQPVFVSASFERCEKYIKEVLGR